LSQHAISSIIKLTNPTVPKVIDLFSGAEGMSEGFVNAGFTVVAAFDKEPAALKTFAANIPARTVCGDIGEIENPREALEGLSFSQIDVIIGGPPCQGFSQVGKARIRSLTDNSSDL
jgi:DNA (cytosine-5)-methyltransferase 1